MTEHRLIRARRATVGRRWSSPPGTGPVSCELSLPPLLPVSLHCARAHDDEIGIGGQDSGGAKPTR
jgi:hypothetical protein